MTTDSTESDTCSVLLLLACCFVPHHATAGTIECGYAGKGSALVSDPAASQGRSVAVEIGDGGSGRVGPWRLSDARFSPGLYRIGVQVRTRFPVGGDLDRLDCAMLIEGEGVSQSAPLSWHRIDSRKSNYTLIEKELILSQATDLVAWFVWQILPPAAEQRPAPMWPLKSPVVKPDTRLQIKPVDENEGDEFLDELDARSAVPAHSVRYPAYIIDQISISPVSQTVMVEDVRPDKVHVYPGESNAVSATVRNFRNRPSKAVLRFTMLAGLTEILAAEETEVTIPAKGKSIARFEWTSTKREFGHEARVEVLVDGKVIHSRSDTFSVSSPIWKTAIQGSGFLSWHGIEYELAPHVESNRRNYVNVEEAFSWQPSSWTDLNPTGEHWWAGQNNFHNSMKGLREWISRSHSHGIKMISYLFPTASGPSGLEWARRHPLLLTPSKVGLNANFDIEDFRLYPAKMSDPALWDYQADIWQRVSLHRGYLKTAVLGADEVIRSAKRFGWEGVRFDGRPTWGPMRSEVVHREIDELGMTDLMKELVPEYYSKKDGKWTGSAISIRNMRYMKHRFRTELGPNFAISSNYELLTSTEPVASKGMFGFDYFRSYCAGGSQVNQERLRKSGSWSSLIGNLLTQVEYARQAGGHHGTQSLDKALGRRASVTFMNVFVFATGSHPYGYASVSPGLGAYSRFMTRYGEFCWDLNLRPVTPEESGIHVTDDAGLLWKRFVRTRDLNAGLKQTVVHLISRPRSDRVVPERPLLLPEWRKSVVVTKACERAPVVWLLSAEPLSRADRLPVRREGGIYRVTIPEHRLWSILVWNEAAPEGGRKP